METNIKPNNMLKALSTLHRQSRNCRLSQKFFESVQDKLNPIATYFGVSNTQALFMATVFCLKYEERVVHFRDLPHHFGCSFNEILTYYDDFAILHQQGLLIIERGGHQPIISDGGQQLQLHKSISLAIVTNQPMPKIEVIKITDAVTFLERIGQYVNERDDENITTYDLFQQCEALFADYAHLPFVNRINQMKLDVQHSVLLCYLMWKTISGYEYFDLGQLLKEIYQHASSRIANIQKILSGAHPLTKHDWIETMPAQFFDDTNVKLSLKSLELLNEHGIKLFIIEKRKGNIWMPDQIAHKELLFSEAEMKQLFLLEDTLKEKNYKSICKRLADKNLPKGITVLLHGAPGTGKTEVVKQLARKTKRPVMKVEISGSKSFWFGESEKLVKRIFTNYKKFADPCKHTPILLFNEADAIINKRVEYLEGSVSKTENAIQNILLEEIENFEGILIATTNLISNLDKAFERRFLFKIPFGMPSIELRAQLWHLKLSHLTAAESFTLAKKYYFSGGQIDNIVRKAELHEIIYGTQVPFDQLLWFCDEEQLQPHAQNQMGFTK